MSTRPGSVLPTSAATHHSSGLCIVIGVTLVLVSADFRAALALPTGITGNSGRQGTTCNDLSQCHQGGVPPVVRIEGPSVVAAGAIATFRFVVVSQDAAQIIGGFNVAASGGTLATLPGEEARLEFGELTHVAPKPNVNDQASWDFLWEAPTEAGTQRLYGAGLSANGNGTRNGDDSDLTSVPVTVSLPGDANCDGRMAAADLSALARAVGDGTADHCLLADATCDGAVTDEDVDALIAVLFEASLATPCAS
jgi:hypothetical protein